MSFIRAVDLKIPIKVSLGCTDTRGNVESVDVSLGFDRNIVGIDLTNGVTVEMHDDNPVYLALRAEIDRQIADDELERKIVKIVRRELDIALYREE